MSEKPESPVFQAYLDGLNEYMAGADKLITILLHTHIGTEHLLELLIRQQLPEPQRLLDGTRISYSTKLRLAHASGVLPERLAGALKKLNKLRNKAAHSKGYRIDVKDLEEICRTVLPDSRCQGLMKGAKGDRVAFGDLILPFVFADLLSVVLELEQTGKVKADRNSLTE